MNTFYHKSVLVREVVYYLDPQPNACYVDVTFGGGGHTRAILTAEPSCRVIAIDWDQVALEKNEKIFKEEFGDRIQFIWGNFAHLDRLLKKEHIAKVDGILADFGTSQDQIFHREGFSFAVDTPLDMRMSPAHQRVKASDIVNRHSEKQLTEMLFELGEERFARQIARAIVQERAMKKFATTGHLARVVESAVPMQKGRRSIHPATRTFQALRIFVNQELDNIRTFLQASERVLAQDGRLVCISFHSLEDRIVKRFFRERTSVSGSACFEVLTKKVVVATPEEVAENPSARSARLRAAQKC
jgi:16S rRNA (cytosine1402-N4)-methyltransferase